MTTAAERQGCSSCGALERPSGHKCAGELPCIDCGLAGELFIADPDKFDLVEAGEDADEEGDGYWEGDDDVAICSGCLQRRLAGHHRPVTH
jgi:hypothetical protein